MFTPIVVVAPVPIMNLCSGNMPPVGIIIAIVVILGCIAFLLDLLFLDGFFSDAFLNKCADIGKPLVRFLQKKQESLENIAHDNKEKHYIKSINRTRNEPSRVQDILSKCYQPNEDFNDRKNHSA